MGCGEGLLNARLQTRYRQYMGVDVSNEAIKRASALQNECTQFAVADVEEFAPDQAFDVVVFNEMLVYVRDPLVLLNRAVGWLTDGGCFIVSNNGSCRRLWSIVDAFCPAEDAVTLVHRLSRQTWTVKLLRPPQKRA